MRAASEPSFAEQAASVAPPEAGEVTRGLTWGLVRDWARRWRRLPARDLLLPSALTLWAIGVNAANPRDVNQYGLLPALPLVYYAGVLVLIVSIGIHLSRQELSGSRLALHLVALIVMVHGTAPLVYPEPRYAWTYKHIGVVQYVNLHGRLDAGVDIYQNWPGLFAVAAWFDRIAGIGNPLAYASWAQLFFTLVTCLELAFAYRALPLTQRERWVALFLYVGGNWVGQDYFAPQAVGVVLATGVLAMALHWLRVDSPPRWLDLLRSKVNPWIRRGRKRVIDDLAETVAPPSVAVMATLFGVYFVLVFTHELSPYIVAIQITGLALIGRIRPRWVALALWGLCLAYLIPRFELVNNTYQIVTALTNPFHNLFHSSTTYPPGLPGRKLAAEAARLLSLGMWLLALSGVVRRVREGRLVLPLAILAFSPLLVVFAHSYGGEAIYRAYLFSLPWTACLAASFLHWDVGRSPRLMRLLPAVAVLVSVGLLFPAFFGLDRVNAISPEEVKASIYFYRHAQPGSILLGSPGFPTRLAANYDEFVRAASDTDPNFLLDTHMWGRMLGEDDLPILANMIRSYQDDGATSGFLVLSTSQSETATMFGILPEGSLSSLRQALLDSPDWSVFYRNSDAVIFRLLPARAVAPVGGASRSGPHRIVAR